MGMSPGLQPSVCAWGLWRLTISRLFVRSSKFSLAQGGPLETAIQDIVGSFAMVVISYQILEWFGPFDISADDTCGSDDVQ